MHPTLYSKVPEALGFAVSLGNCSQLILSFCYSCAAVQKHGGTVAKFKKKKATEDGGKAAQGKKAAPKKKGVKRAADDSDTESEDDRQGRTAEPKGRDLPRRGSPHPRGKGYPRLRGPRRCLLDSIKMTPTMIEPAERRRAPRGAPEAAPRKLRWNKKGLRCGDKGPPWEAARRRYRQGASEWIPRRRPRKLRPKREKVEEQEAQEEETEERRRRLTARD